MVVLGLALMTGLLRYASQPFSPCLTSNHLAFYNSKAIDDEKPVTVIGYVSSYPLVEGNDQKLVIQANTVQMGEHLYSVDGLLRLSIRRLSPLAYGQPVRVAGLLKAPLSSRISITGLTWQAREFTV